MLLPETDVHQGRVVAQKVRKRIENARFNYEGTTIQITLSAGLSQSAMFDAEPIAVVERADAALYHSKYAGRGQVTTVRITATGANRLGGRRPIDLAQLQDWQRQGLVALDAITAEPGPVSG